MTPPSAEWRRWLYALAWLGGGVAMTVLAIWLIQRLQDPAWGLVTAPQRIDILGRALMLSLGGALLVQLGLGLRNAIRNIKGEAGGASFEVSGHEPEKDETR